ncbi:hypothetical protein [Ochrobactrum sp. AP1BH01-1]|jgi:hypothetical protein|uniref:hypothetical protein n=1 Tax=Ochrobactrum sp. AP1BH01-1 TaxID=2823874 RepID=UPI001B39672C|nr:hypothetical protein [Ochrobactrum sp. AP1BH01-1]MBQ0707438.1 hypothetical protein [Ochrobactrum sp. AP1BH01-1]
MIPIREAFEQIGREQFPTEWSGEEIAILDNWPTVDARDAFAAGQRAAFDRCVAVVTHLTQELEAGRAVAITTNAKHERVDVSADYWRNSAYDGRWNDGAQNLGEYLIDKSTSRFIRRAASQATAGEPGAPPKYQKPELQKAFNRYCDTVGFPSLNNEKGWQRQADVQRWLVVQIEELEGIKADPRDTAIKTYARDFMREYSAKRVET